MKNKSYILAALLGAASLSGCSVDKFADINTDPATVTKGNIVYLTTEGMLKFEPSEYTFWFYNAKYFSQYIQASVPSGGFKSDFNIMGERGGQGSQTLEVQRIYREVENQLKQMSAEDAAKYAQIKSMFYPMMVYLGIFDTDVYGDMPYTEAGLAAYTNPMLLTPKYDSMSELYDVWISQLDEALDNFTKQHEQTQITMGSQDFIYKGDISKWARFTNSLKLKLAVRYLNVDKDKAFKIAKEVVSSPVGVLNGLDDDFIYNKGVNEFHFGNGASLGVGSKKFVDLLKKNWDPRVRFFFAKNDFNSIVIQAFFDANRDLPAYIDENVETEIVSGKKVFKGWKGQGEPWVRYYGIPGGIDDSNLGIYADYFVSSRWTITLNDATKTYTPYSSFQEEMIRGQIDYTYPDYPGVVSQDKEDMPWYGMFMSTAEVNLYLAELKLLGADLPKSAQEYYSTAVEMSVKGYNRLAQLNRIPYSGIVYDKKFGATIDLKDGEIEKMMQQADYQLTGSQSEQLEKVYLQQYIHFYLQPDDQFASVRRSGIPSRSSSIYAWTDHGADKPLPRRMEINNPSPSDLMGPNINAAAERQGFTLGTNDPFILNAQRVWIDKNAPNFGDGPNFK